MTRRKLIIYGFVIVILVLFFFSNVAKTFDQTVNLDQVNENMILVMDYGANSEDTSYSSRTGTYEDALKMIELLGRYRYKPYGWQKLSSKSLNKKEYFRVGFLDTANGNKEAFYIIIHGNRDIVIVDKKDSGMSDRTSGYLQKGKFDLDELRRFYESLSEGEN